MNPKLEWSPENLRNREKESLYLQKKSRLTGNIILGAVKVIVIGWLLSKAITPWTGIYDWKDVFPNYAHRIEDARNANANAFVFGSSTIAHHVIPSVLDSITHNQNLSWYNFGFLKTVPPESFYLADQIIDNAQKGEIEVLLFEVLPEEEMNMVDAGNLRHIAQLNLLEAIRRIRHIPWKAPGRSESNWQQCKLLIQGWTEHIIGFIKKSNYRTPSPPLIPTTATSGFIELTPDIWKTGRLSTERAEWRINMDSLLAQQIFIAQDFDYRTTLDQPVINWNCDGRVEPIINQMESLHKKCAEKEIQCLFYFQKLWDTNGCIYFAALEKWGSGVVIESMGYENHKELYSKEDRYGEQHLLKSGAEKLSRDIGNQITARIQEQ